MIANRVFVFDLFAMVLAAWATTANSQSPSPSQPQSSKVTTSPVLDPSAPVAKEDQVETWFGWIATSKQQLRTFVRIRRDQFGKVVSGSMLSPDETISELSWKEFEIKQDGEWKFAIASPIPSRPGIEFNGKQSAPEKVVGAINRGDEKVALVLQKLDSVPIETEANLGADSVWLGTMDLVVRKVEFRVREYSKPPFGNAELPRFVFDSLSQNVPGIPALLTSGDDGKTTLEMKTLDAKFVGRINEAGDEWEGRFTQGKIPLKLLLKRQPAASDDAEQSINKELHPSEVAPLSSKQESVEKSSDQVVDLTPPSKRVSTDFYDEVPFEVMVVMPKVKKGGEQKGSDPGTKLSGTLTIPKQKNDATRSFPAVVMVSGNGPQDRDETIGKHKPFQAIAQFLAKNGVASLRYDDRDTGESTGDYYASTTADFANDAIAVWKFAKSVPEIDSAKIGILGHGEGGLVGPMAAVWEPSIAFLILIAPPGLNGSEVLKSQIDRISELQGMSEADRKVTMGLQNRLQEIASGYITDDAAVRSDIQSAIRQNWEGLKSIAMSQDPKVDLERLRRQLIEQIESQFQQLRMPWYKFHLNYDPTTNWMMIRCPTLAMWGGKDVVVLPELNRDKLRNAVNRNPTIDVQFSIITGLNHLLQTSETGLPEEYETIDETISPAALELIRSWAVGHGLMEK